MIESRSKYRFSRVKVNKGIQACLKTQAVGIKAPLLAYCEWYVLVRKVKKIEQPQTNIF